MISVSPQEVARCGMASSSSADRAGAHQAEKVAVRCSAVSSLAPATVSVGSLD
jgi:hypothetical protein